MIGASIDSPKTNTAFAEKWGLKFTLLCDTDRALVEAFGVGKPDKPSAKRTTFLLDPDGTIRRVFENVSALGHADEVLAAAREVWGG